MKLMIRRLMFKHRIARISMRLNEIRIQREMLEREERICMREANRLRLDAMNLEIKARRHARA